MFRIQSGTTDQYVYFVAVDATDFTTRETGLSSFTVYRSRNGAAAAAMTTPTINETDASNMPGVYELLLDEDMTIGAGNVSEAMSFHITHTGMAPVTLQIELFSTANDAAISTIDSNVDAILADTGTDGVVLSSSTIGGIADQVWDELAADHVAAGSFGATGFNQVVRSATAQAGSGTTITLDASASATDDFYNNTFLYILSGTGAGQGRFITDYNGTTKVATVDTWITNPSSDSVFTITAFGTLPGSSAPTASQVADAVWDEAFADHTTEGTYGIALGGSILHEGTAQAGGASTITLDATGSSATNDTYNYNVVRIISGTGAGQSRQISDYVGASKVATVALAWTTQPSTDSRYQIVNLGVDAATVASIADGVWDEARAGHVAAGSFGERVNANVTQISGDTTAADNAESFFDGTGYAGTNNVMPTVTTLTGHTPQTGDAFARLGAPAGASVSADIAAVKVDTAATLVDTGTTIPATITTLQSTVDGLENISAADVNAQVVDALATDTYAEPGQGAPGATISLAAKINYLYKAWRNRTTQTATTYTLYADDATTTDQAATVSDNGTTLDRGEVGSGA